MLVLLQGAAPCRVLRWEMSMACGRMCFACVLVRLHGAARCRTPALLPTNSFCYLGRNNRFIVVSQGNE